MSRSIYCVVIFFVNANDQRLCFLFTYGQLRRGGVDVTGAAVPGAAKAAAPKRPRTATPAGPVDRPVRTLNFQGILVTESERMAEESDQLAAVSKWPTNPVLKAYIVARAPALITSSTARPLLLDVAKALAAALSAVPRVAFVQPAAAAAARDDAEDDEPNPAVDEVHSAEESDRGQDKRTGQ